ncbi:MAG: ZIP family metal transporter [Winogradskyella sp.]|uniref:ZIP family metal transporter n=1 Tax=Winogradskyella sp. TaxID=1883156 RepID=UPI000F406564|nr:ZIP family metal transporter [Winogradskyella sp.]RNC86362.1 MAG: ZIP family metal transporter [Winogradskyella sp.]
MNKYLFPLYAIIIGVAIAFVTKNKKLKSTKLLLSFSGAFLLALTLFDLLPEVYEQLNAKRIGLLIMCGILLQIILEFFSKGAEHGHVHVNDKDKRFPWLLFISLCIHSFLEGFPIHQHNDMVFGVFVHKIPIAALLTAFLLQSGYTKTKSLSFLFVFAAMTPLGTLISNTTNISSDYLLSINAIVIGIFLHISTTILFESSEGHKFNLTKLIAICLGILIAYIL